jgi:MurNAc alpha-1-phosphate uridylyltransferase
MKAMLLAAGRGERMKPLTDTVPKPLVTVGSSTLIEYNLARLQQAGVRDVVINVSYLGDKIIDHLGDGQRYGLNIVYSQEPDTPLGTGGGIYQALPLLGEDPFIVLSSDVWTDYPLEQLFDQVASDAHLIVVDNPSFHPTGDYGLTAAGYLDIKTSPKYTYASFGVLHPRLFRDSAPGCHAVSPLLEAAMARQAVTGELYRGQWFNVGTAVELNRLSAQLTATSK